MPWINEASHNLAAARAALDALPKHQQLSEEDVKRLACTRVTLTAAGAEEKAALYEALDLEMIYDFTAEAVDTQIGLCTYFGVGGGSRPHRSGIRP